MVPHWPFEYLLKVKLKIILLKVNGSTVKNQYEDNQESSLTRTCRASYLHSLPTARRTIRSPGAPRHPIIAASDVQRLLWLRWPPGDPMTVTWQRSETFENLLCD